MKSFIINLINILKEKKLLFLGIFLFTVYFWDRLIRIRLPRNIPFLSNIFVVLFLFSICCTYIFILYRIFYPPKSQWILQTLIKELTIIRQSFIALDNHIKSIPFIKKRFGSYLIKYAYSIEYWYRFRWLRRRLLLYFFGPSYILFIVFMIDIFWFHQLKYFYYFIPLTISSLILPYILYSINSYVNSLIEIWSPEIKFIKVPHKYGVLPPEDYEDCDFTPDSMYLELEVFLPHHTEQIYFEKENYYYEVSPISKYYKEIKEKYNYNYVEGVIPDYFFNLTHQPFIKVIEDMTQINMILKYYEMTMFYTTKPLMPKMKPFKVILYIGYLICWIYILVITLYNYDTSLLLNDLNNLVPYMENPFSGFLTKYDDTERYYYE